MEDGRQMCCPRFANNQEMLIVLDKIARRYGVPPHQVLQWDPYELGLAVCCVKASEEVSKTITQRLNNESMPVFPVAIISS